MKIFYVILISLTGIITSAQTNSSEWIVESLSFEEGVSHNMIYTITQDHYGFMWFGTMYGLIRYDGNNYVKYRHDPKDSNSLSNDDIVCIIEDKQYNLWIGTYGGGLNKYDRKTKSFTKFAADFWNLSDNWDGVVWDLAEDDNDNIWIATRGSGLLRLNQKDLSKEVYLNDETKSLSLANNHILSLHFDENTNELWIGTRSNYLHKFDFESNNFQRYESITADNNTVKYTVTDISSLNDSTLIIGTNQGYLYFDIIKKLFQKPGFVQDRILRESNVHTSHTDSKNLLWAGTNNGLFIIDLESGEQSRLHFGGAANQKLSSDNIVSIFMDQTGIAWIGTYLGGINKINPLPSPIKLIQIENSNKTTLKNNFVTAFSIHKDKLLVSSYGGLNIFDYLKNTFESTFDYEINLPDMAVTDMEYDINGNLWMGTRGGLFVKKTNQKNVVTYYAQADDQNSLTNSFITCLYPDSNGNVWVGTINGLNKYDPDSGSFHRFLTNNSNLTDNYILSLYEDKNSLIWIGTYKGINRYDQESNSFSVYRQEPGNPKSLSNNYVYDMLEDSGGQLWLATSGGLNKYNSSEDSFIYYTERDGLPSSVTLALEEDVSGNLWISTNKGISKFDKKNNIFTNFDTRDGLQSNMFNNASIKLNNGLLIFGGINGFNIIDPSKFRKAPSNSKMAFTSLKVYDDDISKNLEINESREIELSYDKNYISIEFAVFDFTNPSKNSYKYKLEGFDPDWIYSGNQNSAFYTNLPPGDYTFNVLASNSSGFWTTSPESISIIINPPFWKMGWFYAAFLIVIFALLFLLHRRRVKAQIKRQIELEKIRVFENDKVRKKAAEDFHDELGHHITKISLYSEILKKHSGQMGKEAQTYLSKISDLTKGLSQGVRDFIWTLDPGKESLFEVAVRLKDFGDDLFDKTGISFTVEGISTDFEKIKLSMDWRRHLTLMFKEAMNNALKYANCSNVSLSFNLLENKLYLSLSDDGRGIGETESSGGHGLKNLKKRAEYINGKLEILSGKSGGTEIKLVGALQ